MCSDGHAGSASEMDGHLAGINLVRDGFWVQNSISSLVQIGVPEEMARQYNTGPMGELFVLHLHVAEGLGGRVISMNVVLDTKDMAPLRAGIEAAQAVEGSAWHIGNLADPFSPKASD